MTPAVQGPPPKDEHIFPETRLRPLVIRWKQLMADTHEQEAILLLEEIILESTEMFKRLAQHERFHHTVPLDVLTAAAQEKMPIWLDRWDPAKGSLFSWLSKCSKNAFRSEVVRTVNWMKKVHTTDDNITLERLCGFTDHAVDIDDAAHELITNLHELTCPWASTEIRGSIRYIIECVQDDNHNKVATIRGSAFAFGVSFEMTKFLYTWVLIRMRDMLYDKVVPAYTIQEVVKAYLGDTFIPAYIDTVGFIPAMRSFGVFGGMRMRFPTLADIQRMVTKARLFHELQRSSLDPVAIGRIAKKFGRTERSASEIFSEMTTILDPRRTGDYPIYDDDPSTSAGGT